MKNYISRSLISWVLTLALVVQSLVPTFAALPLFQNLAPEQIALRQQAAAVIGENAAQEIGAAYHGGKLSKFTQLVALGCTSAAVASGDCGSGAFGGVVGEVVGEIQQQRIEQRLHRALEHGTISQEQALAFAEDMRAEGVDLARLAAGLGTALGGGDASAAANTGGTAAEENAFWIPLIMIVGALLETTDKALMAKDAVDMTTATVACDRGNQAACNKAKELAQQMAIDTGVEVTIGAVVPGSKVDADLLRKTRKKADVDTVRKIEKVTNHGLPDTITEGGNTWRKSRYNGRSVYKNDGGFNPNHVDSKGRTNIQRMKEGLAPIGKDGKSIELHHMTQSEVNNFTGSRGAVAEVTNDFHNKNYNTIHIYNKGDLEYTSWRKNNPESPKEFDRFRKKYWKERSKDFQ